MTPWLSVVGIGEDGLDGLSPAARTLVRDAEVLVGGRRHLAFVPDHGAERHVWPSPMSALADAIATMRGRRVCVLATGDPMHCGVGAMLARRVAAAEMIVMPAPSAFSLAAARMGWALEEAACVTLHGRPQERLALHVAPEARLLILSGDAHTPAAVAAWLNAHGFGASRITALAHMGGPREARFSGTASAWRHDVPDFHTLAVECVAGADARWFPRTGGLADEAFAHDGKLTKRAFRALALAKLMPRRGALLWDIGAGCGSVGIEWMRAADEAHAIALEPRADRRALAARNAAALGVPALDIRDAAAPEGLGTLPMPHAVFIGGGLSRATIAAAQAAVAAGGSIVAHAVTLESEMLLLAAHADDGGELVRLTTAEAAPLGEFSGWRPAMPVTQWAWRKA